MLKNLIMIIQFIKADLWIIFYKTNWPFQKSLPYVCYDHENVKMLEAVEDTDDLGEEEEPLK